MQTSVADGFESLRDHAEARRADRAVARAERTAENAEFDAEVAVTFAVYALQEAEYYVLAAAAARADADSAEAAENRKPAAILDETDDGPCWESAVGSEAARPCPRGDVGLAAPGDHRPLCSGAEDRFFFPRKGATNDCPPPQAPELAWTPRRY
jgi:hypothetical protein